MNRDRQVALMLRAVTLGVAALVWLIGLDFLWEARPAMTALWGWDWRPALGRFGIPALIGGSLMVAGGAILVALPIGIGVALYLTEFAGPRRNRWLQRLLQVLAGMPSVVIGSLGWIYLVRAMGDRSDGLRLVITFGLLGLLILPTVATLGASALNALPPGYREGAIALGATRWQAVQRLLLPAARAGLFQATLLAFGRAIGETMIVLLTVRRDYAGFAYGMPAVQPVTSAIAMEIPTSVGIHRAALFGAGAVLLGLSLLMGAIARRFGRP
ncbi:MAG TPA: ABC transporter permease subunit [Symbiobacteriaceae bacterium]|nr:ABC transporter permease subunit [Symbiobacteriaceae bacterium]